MKICVSGLFPYSLRRLIFFGVILKVDSEPPSRARNRRYFNDGYPQTSENGSKTLCANLVVRFGASRTAPQKGE